MPHEEKHQFFRGFDGVAAARRLGDAWVAMNADWGGQILLTCPVSQILCDDETLYQLHYDLLSISWVNGELDDGTVSSQYGSEGESIYVFVAPAGFGIPGGMGGGSNLPEPWVHQEFVELGLKDAILAVLSGSSKRLPAVRSAP